MRWNGSKWLGCVQLVGKYDVLNMSDTGNNVLLNGSAVPVLANPSFVGAMPNNMAFSRHKHDTSTSA